MSNKLIGKEIHERRKIGVFNMIWVLLTSALKTLFKVF